VPAAPILLPPPASATLYCILPYFNYCHFDRRRTLFLEFVARYAGTEGLALVVVEAAEQDTAFDLPARIAGVHAHYRVATRDPIWLKENLINIGISRLPDDWRAVAWVDADVTFVSATWVPDALRALATAADVVQLFQTCASLGPDGEILKMDKGFAFQHRTSGRPYDRRHTYSYWHPGYAWAFSRRAHDAMGGLADFNVLGSGDLHMALALIDRADQSYPDGMHPDFRRRLADYQERCRAAGLRLGYVRGTVAHHWHGRAADRKYVERWQVLLAHQFNPSEDLVRNHRTGLLQLTAAGRRMSPDLRLYFSGRKEDTKTL
jgi:hypothetical protein